MRWSANGGGYRVGHDLLRWVDDRRPSRWYYNNYVLTWGFTCSNSLWHCHNAWKQERVVPVIAYEEFVDLFAVCYLDI